MAILNLKLKKKIPSNSISDFVAAIHKNTGIMLAANSDHILCAHTCMKQCHVQASHT